jgi:predicted DNA binding CopG/RHH family protein
MFEQSLNNQIQYHNSMSAVSKDLISKLLDRNSQIRLRASASDAEEIKVSNSFRGFIGKQLMPKM